MINEHFKYLKMSYEEVGNKVWMENDFINSNLNSSRKLFTDESLELRNPIPKYFEVYALLSGLPFSKEFCNKLVSVQHDISKIIKNKVHYWVKPQNFGVEYCVFKWPNNKWDDSWTPLIKNVLKSTKISSFQYSIHGIQINLDGCIIAKGYDESGNIFKIRQYLKDKLFFLPNQQSSWAHVPLGRILEPLGSAKFADLKRLVKKLSNELIAIDKINSLKFVNENQWYMEEKSILSEVMLK